MKLTNTQSTSRWNVGCILVSYNLSPIKETSLPCVFSRIQWFLLEDAYCVGSSLCTEANRVERRFSELIGTSASSDNRT